MPPKNAIPLCRNCARYLGNFYRVVPHKGLTGLRPGFCECCGKLGLFRLQDLQAVEP